MRHYPAVLPQVKSLIYIHAFINTDPDGPRKHPDARITHEDGTPYENKTYTQQCGIPFFYNYPAPGAGKLLRPGDETRHRHVLGPRQDRRRRDLLG